MSAQPNLHQKPSDASGKTFLGIQSIISAKPQVRTYPYSFAKHIHKSVELYLLDSGTCCMEIGNRQLSFCAGDLVLIYPNIVHSFYLKEPGACAFRHIHFDPEFFFGCSISPDNSRPADILTALISPFNCYFHLRADEKISSLVDGIIAESNEKDAFSDAMANLRITELLIHLIRLEQPRTKAAPSRSPFEGRLPEGVSENAAHLPSSPPPNHVRYVSYALAYIHENYDQKILIPDIASHLNISARYLNKIFFQHMNLTILNYINIYRINQAIELMTNTDLTLTEIAIQTGCKDSQHFSKLFKNIIGLAPNKYRKLILHDAADDDEASHI